MQIHNRQEDLMTVFDRTWKANHNDDIKKAKEREKKFIDRMFNVKPKRKKRNTPKPLTQKEQLEQLQKNMAGMNDFNNQTRLNGLRGKFN